MDKVSEYFVYLYRDASGNPVYVGQGKHAERATVHESKSHNPRLRDWLTAQKREATLEVIGPLHSKEMANAIETAVISACLPSSALKKIFFNVHKGESAHRFRPFGVPSEFAGRTVHPVKKVELMALSEKFGRVLFVRINQLDFEADGRLGYDLASPPSDEDIRPRIDRWWQLSSRVSKWATSPSTSPGLLLAVTGGPSAQSIIASALIDTKEWGSAEQGAGGLLRIPLKESSLDAEKLRGRPIPKEFGLRFGPWRQQQFRLFSPTGFEHETSKTK